MNANGTLGSVIVDSVIAGGAALVGLMAGTAFGLVRADPAAFVYSGVVAFLVAFLASLQAARGRRVEPSPPPS